MSTRTDVQYILDTRTDYRTESQSTVQYREFRRTYLVRVPPDETVRALIKLRNPVRALIQLDGHTNKQTENYDQPEQTKFVILRHVNNTTYYKHTICATHR